VAGLQRLPPRQRAVLVLPAPPWTASSPPATGRRAPLPRSPGEVELVGRFVDAFESADIDRIVG
jgi:hypothetical protein